MKTFEQIPQLAKFYITKDFGHDANGNPRRYYEIFDSEMNLLGYCEDNYAGENFTYGRSELKRISYDNLKGIKDYKNKLKSLTLFKNESLKK